ncbi:hypothetical protein BKA57DRAFT_502869 [Linnemannia elongata]|nr:hypothetical protein BKA57DRAFT_502869 [Linnemannia elongata]
MVRGLPNPAVHRQEVLHKFVDYLETQASERIWKPRCSATIAWEQTQGISAKDKTSKYTGPRGDWSQGYGYYAAAIIVAQSQVPDRIVTDGWFTEEFGQ